MQAIGSIPFAHQQDATTVSVVVDVESLNRRTTDGSDSDQTNSVGRPGEVLVPLIETRVEEWDDRLSLWINSLRAIAATLVAVSARERQVVGVVIPSRRLRNDMIERKTDELPAFVSMAILATKRGSLANDLRFGQASAR